MVLGWERFSIARSERRCSGQLSNPMIGVGDQVLADLENGLDLVPRSYASGNFGGSRGLSIIDQIAQDLPLNLNNAGGGLLSGFNTGLVIGVNINQRRVKPDCALK